MKELLIKCNVGPNERKYRFILGSAALAAAYKTGNKGLGALLGSLGFAGITTAMSRYCPMYHALGINKCQPAYRAFPHLLRRL